MFDCAERVSRADVGKKFTGIHYRQYMEEIGSFDPIETYGTAMVKYHAGSVDAIFIEFEFIVEEIIRVKGEFADGSLYIMKNANGEVILASIGNSPFKKGDFADLNIEDGTEDDYVLSCRFWRLTDVLTAINSGSANEIAGFNVLDRQLRNTALNVF